MVDVKRVADQLDFLANIFVEEPWKIDSPTSNSTVRSLITDSYIKECKITNRVISAFSWLFKKDSPGGIVSIFYKADNSRLPFWLYKVKSNLSMALFSLKKNDNCPDYSLRDGTVVAVWAETGDYLISVQPAVGDKVAKFLRENPANPYAIEIAEEIQKGWDVAFPDQRHKTMYKETE